MGCRIEFINSSFKNFEETKEQTFNLINQAIISNTPFITMNEIQHHTSGRKYEEKYEKVSFEIGLNINQILAIY